jgi:hypothetical protein
MWNIAVRAYFGVSGIYGGAPQAGGYPGAGRVSNSGRLTVALTVTLPEIVFFSGPDEKTRSVTTATHWALQSTMKLGLCFTVS